MPAVTSCVCPSPKLNVVFVMRPSGSLPRAVKRVVSGALPVAGVTVKSVQTGAAFVPVVVVVVVPPPVVVVPAVTVTVAVHVVVALVAF